MGLLGVNICSYMEIVDSYGIFSEIIGPDMLSFIVTKFLLLHIFIIVDY